MSEAFMGGGGGGEDAPLSGLCKAEFYCYGSYPLNYCCSNGAQNVTRKIKVMYVEHPNRIDTVGIRMLSPINRTLVCKEQQPPGLYISMVELTMTYNYREDRSTVKLPDGTETSFPGNSIALRGFCGSYTENPVGCIYSIEQM